MRPADRIRPLEGSVLAEILHQLASVNVIASNLKFDLDPLSDEEAAAGAVPLTPEQFQSELGRISTIVTMIAIEHLKADPSEWYAANDAVVATA